MPVRRRVYLSSATGLFDGAARDGLLSQARARNGARGDGRWRDAAGFRHLRRTILTDAGQTDPSQVIYFVAQSFLDNARTALSD
ncbi:hypothetical protein [Minwuia sp.]|uniref:hypothetical protein n=1 Tax=Minwuia sp. TaxID=2493630 RepID=UPI003A8D94B6